MDTISSHAVIGAEHKDSDKLCVDMDAAAETRTAAMTNMMML